MTGEPILRVVLLVSTLIPVLPAQELMTDEKTSYNDCNARFSTQTYYPKSFQRETAGEYPHLVHVGTILETSYQIDCSGSLIWENIILAPASCTPNESATYFVGLERIVENKELHYNQILKIVSISKHRKYLPDSELFNVALMKLARSVIINPSVLPICLWPNKELPKSLLFYSEDNQEEMTVTVFFTPIADAKCAGEYSYIYLESASSSPFSPQCMKDEKPRPCSTSIRGQLDTRQNVNGKAVPLMVGMMCDFFHNKPSTYFTYYEITKYREWIIKSLQDFGQADAAATVFDVEACSQRFIHLRENVHDFPTPGTFVESLDVKMKFNVHTVKLVWPEHLGSNVTSCYGVHAEPNAIITLAQCTSYLGVAPSGVMFYDGSVRQLREIIVHPNYTRTEHHNYNDIAVLKLDSSPAFIPTTCGWYGGINPSKNVKVKAVVGVKFPSPIDGRSEIRYSETTLVANVSENQCNQSQYERAQIPYDSRDKYLCLMQNPGYGQQSYKIHRGIPIKFSSAYSRYIVGLNLNECDCGFSTPMIVIRFEAHEAWLNSVLLPAPTKPNATKSLNAFTYIDDDLRYSDRCGYADGTKGMCEAIANCNSIQQRVNTNKQIVFCQNQTIVCCPQEANTSASSLVKEFNECENRYGHLRQARHEQIKIDRSLEETSPHLVEIGWVYEPHEFLDCIGYLITTRDVVAIASCLKSKSSDPNVIRVDGIWPNNQSEATFIPIRSVHYHPMYNGTNHSHDIALVTLKSPINPSWALFPGCIWLNRTHAPAEQQLYFQGWNNFENIYPMYRSDCEAYLNHPLTDSAACMLLRPWICGFYYNPRIKETSPKCEANNDIGSYSYFTKFKLESYNIRAPIVWNRLDNDGKRIEYLISVYHYTIERLWDYLEFPKLIGMAHRVSFYISWIAEILEANNLDD